MICKPRKLNFREGRSLHTPNSYCAFHICSTYPHRWSSFPEGTGVVKIRFEWCCLLSRCQPPLSHKKVKSFLFLLFRQGVCHCLNTMKPASLILICVFSIPLYPKSQDYLLWDLYFLIEHKTSAFQLFAFQLKAIDQNYNTTCILPPKIGDSE